ncbi:MAG: hypothetical protein IAE77_15765 [Prosthecobacter sp.]|nr:hypothetical protein [Prosthecobacter sp.]
MSFKRQNLPSRILHKLMSEGVGVPVSAEHVLSLAGNSSWYVIRELAKAGDLLNPELYKGPLPLGVALKLERLGILNRDMLREKLMSHELDLGSMSYIGKKRADRILKWAGIDPASNRMVSIRLRLPLRVLQQLRRFGKSSETMTEDKAARITINHVLKCFGRSKESHHKEPDNPRINR